jgi:hypothetical protein
VDAPTADDIKTWSRLDFQGDYDTSDDQLEVEVGRAVNYVWQVTGRPIDSTFPDPLVSIAQQAIQMRTEQLVLQAQEDYVETATDDLIQNFNAGSYSESRREPLRLTRGGSQAGMIPVNSWPSLNEMLWMLMTDDMQDYWRALFGQIIPAFEVSEVDWSLSDIPASYLPGWAAGGP